MNEGEQKLSKFDALVVGLKKAVNRSKLEGRSVLDTQAIDAHIERKKRQAGSPSAESRQ